MKTAHARYAPGLRRWTPAHVTAAATAARFAGRPANTSKGQLLAAFKQAAPHLGLAPRLRDAIDALMSWSQDPDWEADSRPIVWPSNRRLQEQLGLCKRQVQNILQALIDANLIVPVDSPTGHRWGRRNEATGKIVEAYGFDLSPLAVRHDEFCAIAQRARDERQWRAQLRRRRTIARKAIQQVAETALEHAIPGRDWRPWANEAIALAHTIADETAIPALIRVVTELEDRRRDGEAALTQALAVERSCGKSENTAPSDALICIPKTTTTNLPADKSATGNHPRNDCSPTGDAPPADGEPCWHPRASDTHIEALDTQKITPRFVVRASPALRPYLTGNSLTWAEVVETADRVRAALGISRSAWIEACAVMGRYQAAAAVAIIAAKSEEIRSPGGYLRGMIAKHRAGALRLARSLHGLAEQEARL